MLAEYLHHAPTETADQSAPMEGVTVCRFAFSNVGEVPLDHGPLHFEALFCLDGMLRLHRASGETSCLGPRTILLLSDVRALTAVCHDAAFAGVLVAVDGRAAQGSLTALCRIMGSKPLDTKAVARQMTAHDGCAALGASLWSGAVFADLEMLAAEEQGRYCVWKSLELLYLMSTRGLCCDGPLGTHVDGPMAAMMVEVAEYMRANLDAHLTIDALSAHFGLSPTALKKAFRRHHGRPIHTWLQEQRLEHAAMLLRSSTMTVLEIAQEVGYSSTSQFSTAFARRYGTTPGQYRKLSLSSR